MLLKLFTSKKKTNFNIKNTKKIIFLRYDRIGDMIISTPVFRELKTTFPHIEITVLASKANQDILLHNPYIDKVYTNHKNNFLSDIKTLLKLRKEKFDIAVEFDHSVIPHAIYRLKIINPKKIISVHKQGRYGVKGEELEMYDFYTPALDAMHFRDIWLNTLKPFEIDIKSNTYDVFFTADQEAKAKQFLSKFTNKTKIGINLEGAIKGKKIEENVLYEICQKLYKQTPSIQVIILTTPDKKQLVEKMIETMCLDFVIASYATESILDVAALISQLDLIITPDTSIVHIASAFNKPLISIHENNKDSYRLFAPTSSLSATIFAKSKNGLEDYSVDDIVSNSLAFINILKKNEL